MAQGPKHAARLPPLNPLRAFEAAARHGSFTRAAAELNVTQGAVSQAVKLLEEHLQAPLFIREAGQLRLTPAAAGYAHSVRDALSSISSATAAFRSARQRETVTIRAYTSFLTYWLIPRLPDFHVVHPEIEVRFIAANDRVALDREPTDFRLRYGDGRWRGAEAVLLLADELTPVISPGLLPPRGGPYAAPDLAGFTWLHASQRRSDWADWLIEAGHAGLRPRANETVEELSVIYRLAISGSGVALANLAYVGEEVATGRLYRPVATVLRRKAGYYLTWRSSEPLAPAARLFSDWLLRA